MSCFFYFEKTDTVPRELAFLNEQEKMAMSAFSPVTRQSAPIDIRAGPRSPNSRKSRRRTLSSSASTKPTFTSQYHIDGAVLGEGAYGSVYKCIHRITEIEYAVKIIYKGGGLAGKKVNREIEVYHQCQSSENILHLVELFEDDDKFYLIFELIRGGSLEARIAEVGDKGRIAEKSVKSLVNSIGSALQFLHGNGIAHRDIKPANILLPNPTKLDGAKLCDFDLASRSKTAEFRGDLCMTSPVGSAEFMAPEVVAAFTACDDQQVKYDQSCDIWSLGVIAYSLLSGRPPFEGCCGKNCGWDAGESCDDCMDSLFHAIQKCELKFPEQTWKHISPDAKQLISRCLAKDPAYRPTPDEILAHAWFDDHKLVDHRMNPSVHGFRIAQSLPNEVVINHA